MLSRMMRSTLGLLLMVALPLLVSACEDAPTTPTQSPTYVQTDLAIGTGSEAATGLTVTANYAGWFYDGSKADKKGVQFASSTSSGAAIFVLGDGTVIEGWEKGVPGMRVGGIRRLIIPSSMAYGTTRYGIIPPNTTVIFEIELTNVE